ncbi:MAG: AraC family transcriptional regulator ligand-binding domain-containing protein [Acidobacteriota bacterium]
MASTTAAFALSRGWSMERINETCGVSGLDLVNPHDRLPDDVVPRLWLALWQEWPDEALTLQMARAAPFSIYAGLAEGMQFATDLRQALQLVATNRILIADRVEMELIETDEAAFLTGSHPADAIDQGRTAEIAITLMVRLIREVLGVEDAVQRIRFNWGPWGPVEAYEDFFGVPIEFNQPRSRLFFHKERMTAAISHANTELFAYVEQHFAQAAARIERQGFPAQLAKLREAISDNAAIGEFGGRAAAERAFMSLRSAQRLAATHGFSLGGMIDQVRGACAKELLSDRRITIDKAAQLVGYSDDRAFRRAFKRWTGQTPSQYRA